MKLAYVDTSCLVAIAFAERGAAALARRLEGFDELVSSNLLEAELRSTLVREEVAQEPDVLDAISWIVPDRPLHAEIGTVLSAGYVRGADCWHLASALYLAEDPSAISFLTLDARQKSVARTLGFRA
ncbi:MAG TPA: PIN domain-containing protein [Gemmatimonadaceae bacterium]|nr:PIN domain-containing protein [Gemmatimonadaceae bacterium]